LWKHIDLFSGIGGFAYAFREVFGDEGETVLFCDNDKYCQAVLKKHWPDVPIWSDIRELIAYTRQQYGEKRRKVLQWYGKKTNKSSRCYQMVDLLTGGFPCQPFSQAGKRRGKSDDRFLWPEMLECIRLFYGILSIEGGMVFEQVCSDMEKEGYEVWPFIIPACAVNAPHRRDRVWFVAKDTNSRRRSGKEGIGKSNMRRTESKEQNNNFIKTDKGYDNASNTEKCGQSSERLQCGKEQKNTCNGITDKYENGNVDSVVGNTKRTGQQSINKRQGKTQYGRGSSGVFDKGLWQRDWKEVATATCLRGVDDGLSKGLYNVSEAKHRTERLKMLGNAIVPQVVIEIMRAIRYVEKKEKVIKLLKVTKSY